MFMPSVWKGTTMPVPPAALSTVALCLRQVIVKGGTLLLVAALPVTALAYLQSWGPINSGGPAVAAAPHHADDPHNGLRVVELPRSAIPRPNAASPAFVGQDDVGILLNHWQFTKKPPDKSQHK
jgi:hypothetical protein